MSFRAHPVCRWGVGFALAGSSLVAPVPSAIAAPSPKVHLGATIAELRAAGILKLKRESATRYFTEHYRDSGTWFDDATFDFSPRDGRLIRTKLDISGSARCERMIKQTDRALGKPISGDLSAEHSSSTWYRRRENDYVSVILYDPREGQSTCWKVYATKAQLAL